MKAERLKQMEDYISKRDFVTIDELSQKFSVHKNTVRSDINELAEKGILEKKYGGVSYKSCVLPTSYKEREEMSVESKKNIGYAAARLLHEGDVIYVDAGTTTLSLFDDLTCVPDNLTIITNNLAVINRCFQFTNYNVYCLPGKGDRQMNSFSSFETIESVKSYNIQKAFIGVRGISENGDLSSASPIDARLKKAVLENSRQKILMAEAEKLGHPAMVNFAKLSTFDIWVCDKWTEDAEKVAELMDVKLVTLHNNTIKQQ